MRDPRRVRLALAVFCVALAPVFGSAADPPKPRLDLAGDPLPEGAVARFGTLRFNCPDKVDALLFSPDGKTIVSGDGAHGVIAWDAATGKRLARREAATGHSPAAFTPDGRVILVNEKPCCLTWDPATGEEE